MSLAMSVSFWPKAVLRDACIKHEIDVVRPIRRTPMQRLDFKIVHGKPPGES